MQPSSSRQKAYKGDAPKKVKPVKTNVAPARYPAVTAKNLGKMCENLSSWAMAFSDDSDDMDDKGYMSSYMNVS